MKPTANILELWQSKLEGPPSRVAFAASENNTTYKAFIKLRLGHGRRGSVLVPDQMFIKLGGWKFFGPITQTKVDRVEIARRH